jgi:hypothetical protein
MPAKKKSTDPWSVDVNYEGFCDLMAVAQKEGVFLVCLGQARPGKAGTRWVARFWIDPVSFKEFMKGFQDEIKDYEKDYGVIKT